MIKVGVTENVVLSSTAMLEKNGSSWLAIGFKELGTEVKEKKQLSAAAMLSESSDDAGDSSNETQFSIFAPNMKKFGEETIKDGADLLQELVYVKTQLHHILKRFTVETNIKWSPFLETSINVNDEKDLLAKLQIPAVFEKVYMNICKQFIEQSKKFLNLDNKACRILLVRQSKTKSFGTFRKRFLNDQPFLEAMDIPKENSKLMIPVSANGDKTKFHDPIDGFLPRFTDYELKQGLDNPIRMEAEADKTETSSSETGSVSALFSAGAEETGAPDFSVDAAA